jgi:hypothetical protein
MTKPRGTTHTTLTETAQEVVDVLKKIGGVKMIAPGIIQQGSRGNGGKRFVTIVHTRAGFELIITGQGVQKVAIHADAENVTRVVETLTRHKRLSHFIFKERTRLPGV